MPLALHQNPARGHFNRHMREVLDYARHQRLGAWCNAEGIAPYLPSSNYFCSDFMARFIWTTINKKPPATTLIIMI